MKTFNRLFFVFFSAMFIISCQKELNFDVNGISHGTLKSDSADVCLPSTVNGTYQVDSILGSDNYIDVQVDVATTGTYTIETDTVNGYSFRGTGYFGAAGLNTVRLYGSGEPVLDGVNTFIVTYDSSFCLVDVNVIVGNTAPSAVYTFGGAGGTCTGSALSGTYMESLALNPTNTATVQVSVTSAGSYTITTDTVNGVSFSASGVFTLASTSVTLTGSGTPTATGTFNYLVSGNGIGCSFSVTFDPAAGPAVYTLGGAGGACTGAVIGGTYTSAVAVNSSNTITVDVNVTTIGMYTINTTTVNGVSFAGSGLFSTTGPQQVVLYASGTPAAAGSFDFPVTGGSSTCTVSVPVSAAPTDYITCDLNGVPTTFNVNATAGLDNGTGFPILSIDGNAAVSGSDPSIHLQIQKLLGGGIVAGTYTVNQFASGILIFCDYFDAASTQYNAATDVTGVTQTPAFTINITSITATRVVGTFNGPVDPTAGAGINITNGIFNVPIQ